MSRTPSRGGGRLWLSLGGLVVAAVVIVVALLPSIMSSQRGKQWALDQAAPLLPGELRVERWSLSWFGDQRLTGVAYADANERVDIAVDELTIAKGLAAFAFDRGDVGTLVVRRPHLDVTLPDQAPDRDTPPSEQPPGTPPGTTGQPPASPSEPAPSRGKTALPPISGRLVVEEGQLNAVGPGPARTTVATDIDLSVDIGSITDPIAYTLSMAAPDGVGSIDGEGTVQLDPTDLALTSVRPAGDLSISSWDIAALLELAAAFAPVPTGGGTVTGTVTFAGNPAEGIEADGTVDLNGLHLAGGPLAGDQVSMDLVSAKFTGSYRRDSLQLSSFDLVSPFATGSLTAEIGAGGALEFATRLQADLPEIAAQLPTTLRLREGLQITGGILDLQADGERLQGENRFAANAVVEGLAGRRDNEEISLSEPFSLELRGSQHGDGLNLERFAVSSSFVNGTGRGDLDDLQLTLDADLGAALDEISKFISLQQYDAGGRINLAVEARRSDPETVTMTARLGSEALTVRQGTTVLIPDSPLQVEADAKLLLDSGFLLSGLAGADLTYRSWVGDGSVTGRSIELDDDGRLASVGEFGMDGRLDLATLAVLLRRLEILPETYAASGAPRLSFRLAGTRDTFTLSDLTVEAAELTVDKDGTSLIPGSTLRINGSTTFELGSAGTSVAIDSADFNFATWVGDGSLTGRSIELDTRGQLTGLGELSGDAQFDLEALAALLRRLEILPGPFAASGAPRVSFRVAGTGDAYALSDLTVAAAKLSVDQAGTVLIPEGPLQLRASALLKRNSAGTVGAAENVMLDYASWLGDGQVEIPSLDFAASTMEGASFRGTTDLRQLTMLLGDLDLLPPELALSGTTAATVMFDFTPEQIDLSAMRAETSNFTLAHQAKTYVDEKLVIDTAGVIDPKNRQLSLAPLRLNSANGDISCERLIIGDWSAPAATIDSSGQARFDLVEALAAGGDWVDLPPDTAAAGAVDISWSAEPVSAAQQRFRLKADVDRFSLQRGELRPFTDERAAVRIDARRDRTTGRVDLDELALSSTPLNFDAAGFFTAGAGTTELALDGNLAMDLARLAGIVETFTDLDVEMAGKSERPFKLRSAVPAGERNRWWRHLDFSGAFQADLISMFGVELRSVDVPVTVSDGYGRAEISGQANEGLLRLQPLLDLRSSPPVLTIPDNTRVLDKMQLTPEMAGKLLARLHPLFMGATQLRGTVDLDLARFRWPIGRENINELAFAGSMEFHDASLGSSPLIGTLLQALGTSDTGLDLSGRKILFEAANGRVTTNDLITNLGDSELVLGGSLGLDTTIDYLARVPVTRQLVGGDLYDYLEGTIIQVPIGGTLADPDISAQTVQRTVSDLIKQAGRKKIEEAAGNLLKQLF